VAENPPANVAAFAVDGPPPRLNPPSTLTAAERALFVEIVAACPTKHFVASDLPLLIRYVEALALADKAAGHLHTEGAVIKGKTSPWLVVLEKCQRAVVALSMRLRLSPQSRADPKTLQRNQLSPFAKPWEAHG